MFTPEKNRACDAREPVSFGECVREARAKVNRRARLQLAVHHGNTEALAQLLSEGLTGGTSTFIPATVSPTRLAEFLLGRN